jgi:hypothetical protein
MLRKREVEPEPKSWAELLNRKVAERNKPPAREFYVRPEIKRYEEGGVFWDDRKLPMDPEDVVLADTHLYATTQIFDPEEQKRRWIRPRHDSGRDIISWPAKSVPASPEKQHRVMRRDLKPRDYDLISGKPFDNGFKATVKQVLDKRETARNHSMTRSIDPISLTFPTAELERTRGPEETKRRDAVVSFRLSRMPPNERRASMNAMNVITGELRDPEAVSLVNEFPNSQIERGIRAVKAETRIVGDQQGERDRNETRVRNRFNTGRARTWREWNIVTGEEMPSGLSESVMHKPSVWQWCEQEKLV